MVPTLIPHMQKVATADFSQIGNEDWLLQHGGEIQEMSLNTQNLSDLLKPRTSAQKGGGKLPSLLNKQDFLDAGMKEEDYDAYFARRGDFGTAASKTQLRLRNMAGLSNNASAWEKASFEKDAPEKDDIDRVALSTEDFDKTYPLPQDEIDRVALSTEDFEKAYPKRRG